MDYKHAGTIIAAADAVMLVGMVVYQNRQNGELKAQLDKLGNSVSELTTGFREAIPKLHRETQSASQDVRTSVKRIDKLVKRCNALEDANLALSYQVEALMELLVKKDTIKAEEVENILNPGSRRRVGSSKAAPRRPRSRDEDEEDEDEEEDDDRSRRRPSGRRTEGGRRGEDDDDDGDVQRAINSAKRSGAR